MPTPKQCRASDELTMMVLHGAGRLKALRVFASIFKGKHVKHTDTVALHTGRKLHIRLDCPTTLQIDGETIHDVTEYCASAK